MYPAHPAASLARPPKPFHHSARVTRCRARSRWCTPSPPSCQVAPELAKRMATSLAPGPQCLVSTASSRLPALQAASAFVSKPTAERHHPCTACTCALGTQCTCQASDLSHLICTRLAHSSQKKRLFIVMLPSSVLTSASDDKGRMLLAGIQWYTRM